MALFPEELPPLWTNVSIIDQAIFPAILRPPENTIYWSLSIDVYAV